MGQSTGAPSRDCHDLVGRFLSLIRLPTRISLEERMLSWAVVFFIIAIIAGILGFTGIAGAAASIAQILFFLFLVLFVLLLVFGRRPPPA